MNMKTRTKVTDYGHKVQTVNKTVNSANASQRLDGDIDVAQFHFTTK